MIILKICKVLSITFLFFKFLFAQEIDIVSEGNERSFRVNLPSNTSDLVPLMIILHGLGETSAMWYGPASYVTNQGLVAVRPESGIFPNSSGTGNV